MSGPQTRPDRALAKRKRERYLNTGEASAALNGMISAGLLRKMAMAGEIPGAVKVRTRIYLPKRSLEALVVDLEFHAEQPPLRKVMAVQPLAS